MTILNNFKKYILVIAVTIFYGQVIGQTDSSKQSKVYTDGKPHYYFSCGLSYQKQLVGEIGLGYGYSSSGSSCFVGFLGSLKLATEFNLTSTNFFIAPKISAELDLPLLGARLNIIDYTNFNYHDLKFTPEIGLSTMGRATLFYGYNFSITDKRLDNIGTNRITLTFNFVRELWKNQSFWGE